ncbi:MAG TPA: FAD-dependent monooxygenase [Phycisphaerales bacterium]
MKSTLAKPASLHDVAAHAWDVVIVGAGPAGSAAACRAATLGLRTLIVDRASFPRDKVCGGCLSPLGLDALDALGLGAAARSSGIPLRSIDLTARGHTTRLPLRGGLAIGREELDTMLLRYAESQGATALESTHAALVSDHDSRVVIALRRGDESAELATPRTLVADGLSGSFLPRDEDWSARIASRSRIGLGARVVDSSFPLAPGVIAMCCGRHGYVGMVRLRDGSIDLAAAVDPAFLRACASPARAVYAILREAAPKADHADRLDLNIPFRGTGMLTRRRAVERGGVLIAGDAAAYVEPFTGEGMSWAMHAGMAAAELIAAGEPAGAWTQRSQALLSARQRRCRAVALALRSPTLVAFAARAMALMPAVAPLAQRLVAGPWARNGIAEATP